MDHLARFLPNLSSVFDHSSKAADETAESTTKTKPEPLDEEAEVSPERVPLVETHQSHENLAFEDVEYLTKPQNTSVESSESEKIDKEGDDSGIADSDMDGKNISCVQETSPAEAKEEEKPANRDYQPVLKSIGTFAMQFMVASAPEIKVEKPKTLAAVAATEENGETRPPPSARQPSRRHTDHMIKTKAKDSLAPEMATPRRHSDFAVSAPRPINEELAEKDLKKHGAAKKNTKDGDKVDAKQARKESQSPDVIRATRGPQWSPRLERKRREEAMDGTHKQERRKTLAEIAKEAGYPSATDGAADMTEIIPMPKTAEPNLKGSNESLLGEHEEEHYSGIRVTGEIFVSLRYEMKSKKFEVHIHSANNLAAADAKKSSSDPYVKSYLLPDRRSKRKTKTKKDTLNPVFDEILEYFIGYDELLTRSLFLSVWHKVIGRNEFLGEVKINMNAFLEAGYSLQEPTAKWFTLAEKSDITDGLPSSPAELVLALKYVTADKVKKKRRHKGELHVHLLEARNLPGMDGDGMSDPYCRCFLLPVKKGRSKYKTPVVKRTLNPSFDYKFSCDEVSLDDLKERALEITIWDFDRASSDEFLGGVRLGLGTSPNDWDDATEDESQIWHTMLSRSNVWIQVVVPLRSSMNSKKKNSTNPAQ